MPTLRLVSKVRGRAPVFEPVDVTCRRARSEHEPTYQRAVEIQGAIRCPGCDRLCELPDGFAQGDQIAVVP